MMVDFEKVFHSNNSNYDAIHHRAVEEHWCSACAHCECERDGDWCKFLNTAPHGPCLFWEEKLDEN